MLIARYAPAIGQFGCGDFWRDRISSAIEITGSVAVVGFGLWLLVPRVIG